VWSLWLKERYADTAALMWDVLFALLVNFFVLTIIGAGPALCFLPAEASALSSMGISPAAGFIITSLVGTYLTLLGYPVEQAGILILIIGMTLSLVCFVKWLLSGGAGKLESGEIAPLAASIVILCVLTLAPQLIGGLRYSILRGNGTDSFNYITLAGYLDHESYSWALQTDVMSLVERHPSYERAHQLLSGRWTTSMMLALTSRVGGVAPYRFEYSFSVLSFLLAFGPAYLFCRRLSGLTTFTSALTATAVCGGFWAQAILDMRADSELTAIPVLLFLAFLIASMEADGDRKVWRQEVVLVAASGASLFFLYPEMLPFTILGIALFASIRIWQGQASRILIVRLGGAASLGLIAAAPGWRTLLAFGSRQLNVATSLQNNWDQAYFPWLYASPLTGIWGFGPFAAWKEWMRVFFLILGAFLTVVLIAALVHAFFRGNRRSPGSLLAATLSMSALLQWGYLCAMGQLWAGAKGLSFGYAFLLISVAVYTFQAESTDVGGWGRTWKRLAKIGVCGMLWSQCGLAFSRPILAWRDWEYPNYINGHGEYKRHDWNMRPFTAVFEGHRGSIVWSDLSNPWLADYVGLVFGWDVRIDNIGSSRDIDEFKIPQPWLGKWPDYLLVERSPGVNYGGALVAQNSELSLLRTDGGTEPILSIANANGLEGSEGTPFFWLGTKPVTVTVFSPTESSVLTARFGIGPSNPDLHAADLIVTSDADGAPQHIMVTPGTQEIQVHTRPGLNQITIQDENPVVRSLPTDPRPLLLHVEDLRFKRGP